MRGSRRTGLAIFHPTMTAGVLRAAAEQYRRQPMYSALGRRLLLKVGTDSEDPRISANWPCGPVVRQKATFSSTGRDAFFFSRRKRMGGASPRRDRRKAAGLPRHPRPTGRPHSAKEKRRSRAHGRITPHSPLMAKWAKKVRRHPASKRDGGGSGGRRVSGRRSGETGRQRRPGREPRTRGVCPRGRNPACGGV